LSEDPAYGSVDILASALTTAEIFWLAHVYAGVLGERLAGDERRTSTLAWVAMGEEWPLIQAAALPCAALLLSVAGLYSRDIGVDVGIGLGVASLFAFGFVLGWRLHRELAGATLVGAISGLAGVVIVALKLIIH
jgi:hypothetical protein